LGKQGTLMPYASFQHAQFTRLDDPVAVFDLGITWLINKHNGKLSLDYQNRPVFEDNGVGEPQISSRRSSVILQYQVSF
jgi:hypothetical protein